jgi:hypothetical protein
MKKFLVTPSDSSNGMIFSDDQKFSFSCEKYRHESFLVYLVKSIIPFLFSTIQYKFLIIFG